MSDGKYSVNTEIYQKNKGDSEKTGDTYYIADIKNGKLISLSDGMGSGNEASKTSNEVISILEKLLASGFNNNTITKIINGVLKLKENSNVSATLDMTVINLANESLKLVKMGAAPTYILSNGNIEIVEKDNLPLGLSDKQLDDEYEMKINSPMIIINISDGAYADGLDEYLKYISKKNIDLVTEKEIIDGILERTDKNNNDDITIIVTKIE